MRNCGAVNLTSQPSRKQTPIVPLAFAEIAPDGPRGLVSMRNVYFACDMDANGRTIGLSYETNVGTLYTADGLK